MRQNRVGFCLAIRAVWGVGLLMTSLWVQLQNPGWSQRQNQSALISIPGEVLNSQINSQQKMWQSINSASLSKPDMREDIIYTDRFKNPISQQEFMREIQIHHANIYNNSQTQSEDWSMPRIELPPPQDASFQ